MSFLALATLLFVTSCTKEDVNVQDTQNFINSSLDGIERSCKTGKHGCFEFVWPISLEFADGAVTEFEDQDALRAGIVDWKEANPDATTRPDLVFPIDILDEEGTLFNIISQEELRGVVSACRDSFGQRGHSRKSCVEINYPVNITFPDSASTTFDDRRALKEALKSWKEVNPDVDARPAFAFPISVTIKDTEEVVEVNNKEELRALKEACRNN